MTAFTDYAENRILDWFFRGQAAPALPASWYFGLLTADTSDAASPMTEVSGGSYARAAVARSLAAFAGTQGAGSTAASSGVSGLTSNNADIVFPVPSGTWGMIVAVGLFDAAAAGQLWAYSSLTIQKSVSAGDAAPKFPAAALTFLLDN